MFGIQPKKHGGNPGGSIASSDVKTFCVPKRSA